MATHALDKHLILVGFMGAGKTTIGEEVARRLGRDFVDTDAEIERREGSISDLFHLSLGEQIFREREREVVLEALARTPHSVVAFGGGAVMDPDVRAATERRGMAVWLEVDLETAWARVAGDRPLAADEDRFRELYEVRAPLYDELADARARDADDVVLGAGGVDLGTGALQTLGDVVASECALVTEPVVAGIHGADAQLALGALLRETHELPTGESAKTVAEVERLWRALRISRRDTVVALGGGSLTDAAGFAAATYLRGVDWVPVPTTLVGQVDAAIGGKTAIDIPEGKNLVGAFHWPVRTVIDPALLETLPPAERKNGMSEVVKTGLLAGEPLWELPDAEMVRRSAAFKAAVCLRDPYDRGVRRTLNLGHTFAHALEAAAGYDLAHGHAVALGLRAALELSGRDTGVIDEVLAPEKARVDSERAWDALLRDKKGRLHVILVGDDGGFEAELPEADVRAALGELIEG